MGRAVWSYRWQTAGGTVAKNVFTSVANRRWTYEGASLELKEEILGMALLDSIVDANFRSEPAGQVVIFPGARRHRGYLVKSAAEELKIRSFLKMFYFAHFSILSLGYFLAFEWSRELSSALGRPFSFFFRMGTMLGFYAFIVGVPYWLLLKSCKKGLLSFVSGEDEIVLSRKNASRRHLAVSAGLIALAILILLGAMFLVRSISVSN